MQYPDHTPMRERLEAVLHYGGGGALPSLFEQEIICGAYFRDTEPDYRILADSFLDFFLTTLRSAAQAEHDSGWRDPWFGLCVIEFVAHFRGFRAAELLAANGYLFDGYARLRELRDQALALGAIAGGLSSFPALYGCAAAAPIPSPDVLAQADTLCRSAEEEGAIAERMLGKSSGFDAVRIAALHQWSALFDLKAQGRRSTAALEMKAWSADKSHFLTGPRLDKQTGALYARRFIEVAWMTLRTLPLLQTGRASFDGDWRRRWEALDQSMRLGVVAGLSGDAVSAAFVAMLDAKFSALSA